MPGQHVQYQIHQTRHPGLLQPRDKFPGRIFQTEHKQQQDHANFTGNVGEILDPAKSDETAFTKGEARPAGTAAPGTCQCVRPDDPRNRAQKRRCRAESGKRPSHPCRPTVGTAKSMQHPPSPVGANNDNQVIHVQGLIRPRRSNDIAVAQQGNDGGAGPGAHLGVAQGAAGKGGTLANQNLVGCDAGEVFLLRTQLGNELGGAQQRAQASGLLALSAGWTLRRRPDHPSGRESARFGRRGG